MGWKSWLRHSSLLWALACLSGFAASQTAIDLDGRSVDPFSVSSDKTVVLVFLRRDCPVSGRYAPVIQRASKEHASDAEFFLVYPDRSETPEAIRKSVGEYGYHLPVLRDSERALVKLSHVQITPEVAVFDRNHKLIYDGRIDDFYIDLSRTRPAPTTHELEDAIRAAQSGQTLAHKEVRGVGCYISDLE